MIYFILFSFSILFGSFSLFRFYQFRKKSKLEKRRRVWEERRLTYLRENASYVS
jgi:hypothetical protein